MDDEKFISQIVKETNEVMGHPMERSDIPTETYTDAYRRELKDVPKYTDSNKQREQ